MSYRIQVKIEIIDEDGLPINIKGHSGEVREKYSPSDLPLVTCDKGSTGYPNPQTALTALNNLHAVVKPLVEIAA